MTDIYVPDGFANADEDRELREYQQAHDLANRMQHLTTVAPYLADDAEVLSTVAQMPVPTDQLQYLAGTVNAGMKLDSMRVDLDSMEPGRARSVWSTLTEQQQRALESQGYRNPDSSEGGSNPSDSFFSPS